MIELKLKTLHFYKNNMLFFTSSYHSLKKLFYKNNMLFVLGSYNSLKNL